MYLWAAMLASSALTLSLIAGRAGRVVGLSIAGALALTIVVVPRILRRGTAWDEQALRDRIHNVPGEAGQT
jgi:hypothetical protein